MVQNDIKIEESIETIMFALGTVLLFLSAQHRLETSLVLASDFLRNLINSCSGLGDLATLRCQNFRTMGYGFFSLESLADLESFSVSLTFR